MKHSLVCSNKTIPTFKQQSKVSLRNSWDVTASTLNQGAKHPLDTISLPTQIPFYEQWSWTIPIIMRLTRRIRSVPSWLSYLFCAFSSLPSLISLQTNPLICKKVLLKMRTQEDLGFIIMMLSFTELNKSLGGDKKCVSSVSDGFFASEGVTICISLLSDNYFESLFKFITIAWVHAWLNFFDDRNS